MQTFGSEHMVGCNSPPRHRHERDLVPPILMVWRKQFDGMRSSWIIKYWCDWVGACFPHYIRPLLSNECIYTQIEDVLNYIGCVLQKDTEVSSFLHSVHVWLVLTYNYIGPSLSLRLMANSSSPKPLLMSTWGAIVWQYIASRVHEARWFRA